MREFVKVLIDRINSIEKPINRSVIINGFVVKIESNFLGDCNLWISDHMNNCVNSELFSDEIDAMKEAFKNYRKRSRECLENLSHPIFK